MFYKYEIKNNGTEDVLYLYLSINYEFSRELVLNSKDDDLARRARNFIKNNNINYTGKKVYLVIDGIVVKTLDISLESNPIEILKDSLYYSNEHFLVSIKLQDNSMVELPLKEYLLGVLATNSIVGIDIEVIKALCILYRTYAFYKMSTDKFIDAFNDFALYKPISYFKLVWTVDYDKILEQLNKAIKDTDCLFITYNDNYILPFIHYSNTGKTFYHRDYPYLSSVKSLWDLGSPYYVEVKSWKYDILSNLLGFNISKDSTFTIIDVDSRDYVKKLSIDKNVYTGEEFKRILGLKSMNINIIVNNEELKIISKGYGNGYGLSLYGANEMALNGCDFANIIKYYFPKVKINKYIKELS